MFNKLILLSPDANNGEGSSDLPNSNTETEKTNETQSKVSLLDKVRQAAKSSGSVEVSEENGEKIGNEEESGSKNQQDNSNKGEESGEVEGRKTGDETVEGGEEQKETKEKVVDDSKLTFNEHPRWKQVKAESEELKQQVESLKPVVERDRLLRDYMRNEGISAQELSIALEFCALIRKDPAAAFEKIKPTYDALASYKGEILPQDLQQEVTDGALTLARAKEIAQLRAGVQHKEVQDKRNEEDQLNRQVENIRSGLFNWGKSKMTTNPGFKPKSNGQSDGLWEAVDAKFMQLCGQNPPGSVEQAIALAESAYSSMSALIKGSQQRKPVSKILPPSRNGSLMDKAKLPTSGHARTLALVRGAADGTLTTDDIK